MTHARHSCRYRMEWTMEYQRSRRIQAAPDDVFSFVSDIRNVSTYVPTVESAEAAAEGRVRVRSIVDGTTYEDEGWFHVDHNQRGLEWRVDENNYSGWMTVTGADDGATEVVVHLSLTPKVSDSGRPLTGESSAEPDPVEASLEAAMDSLRNLLEGTGGKERPSDMT